MVDMNIFEKKVFVDLSFFRFHTLFFGTVCYISFLKYNIRYYKWYTMEKKAVALILFVLVTLPLFSGCLEENGNGNQLPTVDINYPSNGMTVSGLVKIFGDASDPDGDKTLEKVEVMINDSEWTIAEGTANWSFDWVTYQVSNAHYDICVRAWDGTDYSDIEEIAVVVSNPETAESDAHKWAIFVAAANYPTDNESKLGNGGLNLAEDMAAYFIESFGYSTSNIFILFDDGWIRDDNGYGERIETLQQRNHEYDINYGGATRENVEMIIYHVIEESNGFADSEVFIWFFGHGHGNENDEFTGGKILESSAIFIWDEMISDREIGELLYDLRSEKTCIIVDACFSGGFADKTIYNFPTFFLMRSDLPNSGRIVITGSSKFRTGFASTTRGPLFSMIWFDGLITGEADGFKSGFLGMGKPPFFRFNKDGKITVEEAFYYATYMLKTDSSLDDYERMEPQINDQYPNRGHFRSKKGMLLGD